MNYTLIDVVWTITVMVIFIGIVVWAYSSKRKQRFDDASHIPFNEDAPPSKDVSRKENSHG